MADAVLYVCSTGGHLDELVRLAPRLRPPAGAEEWVTFDSVQSRRTLAGRTVHYIPPIEPKELASAMRALPAAHRLLGRRRYARVVSTGAAVAVPFSLAARARGVEMHYIESCSRRRGPSLTGRMVGTLPGVRLYTQHQGWAGRRWQFGGSVLDGYAPAALAGGARPAGAAVPAEGDAPAGPGAAAEPGGPAGPVGAVPVERGAAAGPGPAVGPAGRAGAVVTLATPGSRIVHSGRPSLRRVLVTFGTQRGFSFRRAAERLARVLPEVLAPDAEVLWQTGWTYVADLGIDGLSLVPPEELAAAAAESDLIVAHAGLGSALLALDAGRCPVLLPRRLHRGEHTDDHQTQLAGDLDDRGLAVAREADRVTAEDLLRAASMRAVPLAQPAPLRLRSG
jgi:UDP-N-acetylglucosamine transferase subunit ALG13